MAQRFSGIVSGAMFPVLVMGALAGLTTWLITTVRNAAPPPVRPLKHEPDYVVNQFRLVRLNDDGTLKLVMQGDRYTHYPDNDLSKIERLVMTRYPVKETPPGAVAQPPKLRAPTRVRADEAYLVDSGNEARLYGNVVAHRPAFNDKQAFTAATPYAQYVSDFSLLRTPDVAKVFQGASVVRGKGMEYDDITKQWRILSNVQAVFEKKEKDRPTILDLPPTFLPGKNADYGVVPLEPLPPAIEMLAPRLKNPIPGPLPGLPPVPGTPPATN
jgi:lipopolysaccharide export system protein LptC